MSEAFIVRRGGGGSGGTLVVTSSGAGIVTVSNSTLGKSYSKSVTAGGSVTFKGLKTGEWTITLSNGAQTTTRSVTINADYSVSVAYFSATISITYPATSTCVVTNSSGQTVASDTNTGSSTKTWTATVGATGTYTVTATATDGSGKTKSTTVSITADGQSSSVTLSYELYLYKNGDKCTDVGGNWSFSKKYPEGASISYGADKVTINLKAVHQQYMGVCFWYKKIDITNYRKLCMLVSYNSAPDAAQGICVCSSATDSPMESGNYDARQSIDGSSDTVPFELDISAISGSKYVGYGSSMSDTNSGSVQIKEVYLV